MLEKIRPTIAMLSKEMIEKVIDEAMDILEIVGIHVANEEAKRLLADRECRFENRGSRSEDRLYIPRDLVAECLKTTPPSIRIYNREGEAALELEDDNVYFDPGSSVLQFLD